MLVGCTTWPFERQISWNGARKHNSERNSKQIGNGIMHNYLYLLCYWWPVIFYRRCLYELSGVTSGPDGDQWRKTSGIDGNCTYGLKSKVSYAIIPSGLFMMTSSNGKVFRVTGHLCGEFTGPRWIPHTKASDAELWCFLDLRLNKRLSKQWWSWWFETLSRQLWRHRNDYCCLLALGLYCWDIFVITF